MDKIQKQLSTWSERQTSKYDKGRLTDIQTDKGIRTDNGQTKADLQTNKQRKTYGRQTKNHTNADRQADIQTDDKQTKANKQKVSFCCSKLRDSFIQENQIVKKSFIQKFTKDIIMYKISIKRPNTIFNKYSLIPAKE